MLCIILGNVRTCGHPSRRGQGAAPQDEGPDSRDLRETTCGEEPPVGGRLAGWRVLRRESSCNEAMSPWTKASFFARLHFLIVRSFSIASVIRSNHCEKTSSTGLRASVYPLNVPALC